MGSVSTTVTGMGLSVVACLAGIVRGDPITAASLVREMTDLRRLAEFPSPFFQTVQFSSHNRHSSLPAGPMWFANKDGGGRRPVPPNFERVLVEPREDQPGKYLICDVRGPGAIVRLWTAGIKGVIRMYLDHSATPVYDGPAEEFFLRIHERYAADSGLDQSLLVGTFSQRNACYFPIPFSKGCRIVWVGSPRQVHFYHVQIRRYEPAAEVSTFQPADLKACVDAIREVAGVLADPASRYRYRSSRQPIAFHAAVPPGGMEEAVVTDGAGAIERLVMRVSAADRDQALRQTILHVECDGYPQGQVQAPVGDFFGAGPGVNPFDSLPMTVEADGTMTCRYLMPFARSCRLQLENLGDQPVSVTGSVLPMDYEWNDRRSMHFRARWRINHDVVADWELRAQDMPYLLANGSGRYVGTALMLLNPNPIPTSSGNWWGEGDEKIFVDDDVLPSTFGTGSEDYFNYSWCSPDLFALAFCGQPRDDGPANRGFVVNYRWHMLDSLPFRRRLSFYMELFSHERTPGFSYARMAYHYGRPGLMDDHRPITREDVRLLNLPPDWKPATRRGAVNSVFYQAEELLVHRPGERLETGFAEDNLWSGGRLLVWRPHKVGEQIAFRLPVGRAGRYRIHLVLARSTLAGRVSVSLDGKRIGFGEDEGIDLHEDYHTLSRDTGSPQIVLAKGDHDLLLRYEGCSESVKFPMIGIDFIWVQTRR